MKGERKLTIAVVALAVFLVVMVLSIIFATPTVPAVAPLQLGGGISAICVAIIYGYYKEYQFNKPKE